MLTKQMTEANAAIIIKDEKLTLASLKKEEVQQRIQARGSTVEAVRDLLETGAKKEKSKPKEQDGE